MDSRSGFQSPLPDGWLEEYTTKADFEKSFEQLDGLTHFYAEALRGSIRSQQLRFEEAWEHFDKANLLSEKAEESIPNLIRQFLLHIWCFENAIVEAPLLDSEFEPPGLSIPPIPEEVLKDYPEVKLVINLRRKSEAVLRLHLGHWDHSAEIYQSLIEDNQTERGDLLSTCYIGLAACQHNLGLTDEAFRNLENAGFALLSEGKTIQRAKTAGVLFAIYKHLEDDEQAKSWKQFLQTLPCPQATKDIYLRRGEILLERCAEKSSLLVI